MYEQLLDVVKKNDVILLEKFLKNNNIDVNIRDKDNWTVLMHASVRNYASCVETLIKSGANVNAQKNTSFTALMLALMWGRIESVIILIKEGADVNIKDYKNKNALRYAKWSVFKKNRKRLIKIIKQASLLPLLKNYYSNKNTNKKFFNYNIIREFIMLYT